ncbi:CD225/dispanin family protein [Nocardia sp. CA-129566]|uniref:CD225/dispanin family protein n=1 Tax=Nocardia sp. CA-129566 TaxID=3239976 RepID=UPI003D9949C6
MTDGQQTGGYGYPTNQPGYGPPPGYGYPPAEPPAHLGWAIGATIIGTLTCMVGSVLGIVSIVFGAQVHSKWHSGDFAGALDASKKARAWAIAATVANVVCAVLAVGYLVVTLTSSSSY